MKKIIILFLAVSLLIMTFAAAGCASESESTENESTSSNMAPDFTLNSLSGESITLSDYFGSPIMLLFWTTWCGPCRAEMPLIQEIYEDGEWADKGLALLAVNGGESAAKVEQYVNELGLTFTILLDGSNEVFGSYGIRAIPTTVFIDKNGIIKTMKIGAFTSKQQIEDGLQQIIE